MTYITDTQVEQSCATLRKAIEAAENSNHAGEVFVVAAANVPALVREIERIADDFCPDRDADAPLALSEMRDALRTALTLAKGGRV